MKNTKNFVQENKITMSCEQVESNPNINDKNWNANHYKVTFKYGKKQLTTYFSQGLGHKKDPVIEDVLDSLAMDAYTYINKDTFKDFCSNFGYDEDSRSAEKTYNLILNQSKKLENFLGVELFKKLINEYERL